ncbi:integrase-like protein [Kribbella sp. VKM Ac-2571]|nr:integrase-like protein [Kribbella sp. VKM Ac-2571]
MICRFIAEHRARFGVASICAALSAHGCQIAPRTYYAWARRAPSKRALWELAVTEVLAGYYEPDEHDQHRRRAPESLYGSLKMWAHLNRQGFEVARCTVERLMKANGWRGATRAKKPRTTVPDPAADRAPDLVNRQFRVPAPNRLMVADFTYVRLAGGAFAYTAFVIDAFAGFIAGWESSMSKHTTFVERAIRQAAELRLREGKPLQNKTIHHSDAGSPNIPRCTSPRPCNCTVSAPRSGPWATPTTTPWPRPPSGSTRPNASATTPPFAADH